MTTRVAVAEGDQVFTGEGVAAFGAVRLVREHDLIVDIEGAGDVSIPGGAVLSVHDGKVIVDVKRLDDRTRRAVADAHRRETE